MMKLTEKQKKQMRGILLIAILLAGITLGKDIMENRDALVNGIPRGQGPEDIYEDVFVAESEDGSRLEIPVTVYPKQLSEQEVSALLEQALAEFEACYLGDNASAEEVSADLVFPPSYCQGMVTAMYETDHSLLIWEDGSVDSQGIAEGGEVVTLQVTFSCQEHQMVYSCYVRVMPPVLSPKEQEIQELLDGVAAEESSNRDKERFRLPDTVLGETWIWRGKIGREPWIFLLLGIVGVVCVVEKTRQDQRQAARQRENTLLLEYPRMVNQLSLLMGAGMPLFTAWERMVKRYLQEQQEEVCAAENTAGLYMTEMLQTYREIQDGKNLRQAYEDFGNRIGLAPYRKLTAMLVQNMNKGNRDLVRLLDLEADLMLTEQKNQVRRQGEEAGSRLLFPMMLLFGMILVVIMVPALQSF